MEPKHRVNLPPDPNPRKPRFTPPPLSCDTHFHVWGPPQIFPYAESRLYTPPTAPIEHFFGMASVLGIERGVLVHPSVHGTDHAVTLDALGKGQGRLRAIVPASDDLADDDIARLHAAGVRGVRFTFIKRLGGSFDAAEFDRIVSRIAAHKWMVDLHTGPRLIEEQAALWRRVKVPLVVDGFAGIDASKGVDQPEFRTLLDLAASGKMWVKVTNANRMIERGANYGQVVALAQALIARAPDRIIWGTDWPHSGVFKQGGMANDGDLLNMLLDFAPDEFVRRKILADTPGALFFG